MPEPTITCPIDGCNVEFRRDAYIKHMTTDHKEWLSKEMKGSINLGALNDCIKGKARAFYLNNPDGEEDYYICFGTKRVYTNRVLAERACAEKLAEHRTAWMELHQQVVSFATLIDMGATKWAQYEKYATETKANRELDAANARIAELEAKMDAMAGRLREERVGDLEAEVAEVKAVAARNAYEADKWRREHDRVDRTLQGMARELEGARQRQMEVSLESAELGLKAMEYSQSTKTKLEEYPKLKEKVKKLKKVIANGEKEMQKRAMAMMMAMGSLGGMGGGGAAAASIGSRRSVASSLDSDSDDE